MEAHVVQRGETLWKISRQYDISFEELRRVNAHLANPDYVVPGMKIFIPAKAKDANAVSEKKPSIEKKPTPPVQKEAAPQQPAKQEVQPKPTPKPEKKPAPTPPEKSESKPVPKPVPKPKPKPESKPQPPKPELEKPAPPPAIPPVQTQPAPPTPPVQPYPPFPMIGVPCGWLPIYDADCFQYMHPNQMHRHSPPMQQLPVELEPTPTPPIPRQPTPPKPPVAEDWKNIVSPSIEEEVFIPPGNLPNEKVVEPSPVPLPTPTRPTPQKPKLQQPIPLPEAIIPSQSNHGNCMYCGGQSSYPGHPLQCNCQMQPMFMPMPPPPQHPTQQGICHTCQQPRQNMQPMMPFPMPAQQWYGMY